MAVIARDQITLSWQLDIKQTIYYYKKQSSTSAAPAKPTSYPPSGWSTTEPAYSTGETSTLYVTVCTIFSDNTYEYSDVTVSSSFEAAKAAYNKAAAAEGAANNAMTAANGKNKIFYQNAAPASGMSEGDLWFDTDGGNAIHEYKKTSSNPDTYAWVLRQFGTGSLAAGSVTASEINVNNLAAISAYLGSAVIGGLNNTNGVLTVKDASGNTIGTWNKDGINAIAGTIGGFTISGTQLRSDVTVSNTTYSAVIQSMGTSTDPTRYAFYTVTNGGTATNPFYVRYDGYIHAEKGNIAGWTLSYSALYNGTTSMSSITPGTYVGTAGIRQYASSSAYVNIQNGVVTAKGANITGTITANGGSIGGFDISSTQLRSDVTVSGTTYSAVINKGTASDDFAFYTVTNSGAATNPFYVRYDGYMRATNANITGTITANGGSIGGFDISSTQLRSDVTVSGTKYSAVMQSMGTSTDPARLAFFIVNKVGSADATNPFYVRYDGYIHAEKGNIAGWTLSYSALYNGTTSMSSTTPGTYIGTAGIRQYASSSAYVNIQNGVVTAKGANITGTITADGGSIGGFDVSATQLRSDVTVSGTRYSAVINQGTANTDYAFYIATKVGDADATNPFYIRYDGYMKTTSGTIGPWNINSTSLYKGSNSSTATTTGSAYIGNAGVSFVDANMRLYCTDEHTSVYYLSRNKYTGISLYVPGGDVGTVGLYYNDYQNSISSWMIYYKPAQGVVIPSRMEGLTVESTITASNTIAVIRGNAESAVKVENSLHNANLTVNSNGLFCLWSVTKQLALIQMDVNGITKVRCPNGMYRPVGSIDTDGQRVGVFATPSATTLRVYAQKGTAGASYGGYITFTGTSSSDIRLKDNIRPVEVEALPIINQIEMKAFDWIPGQRDYKHQPIGMIADEIEKLDERLVIGGGYDPDGTPNYKVIDDHYLVCYLTKAVQELSEEINKLKERAA